jgi:carbonic anhydrase
LRLGGVRNTAAYIIRAFSNFVQHKHLFDQSDQCYYQSMPQPLPHTAKAVILTCIDDRIPPATAKFLAGLPGGAFHPALAGGGAALLSEDTRETALKQIIAAYQINHISTVYLESHTDCGAYRLAGVTFDDSTAEIAQLYGDLDRAAQLVRAALAGIGANEAELTIQCRVIDPTGELIAEPNH